MKRIKFMNYDFECIDKEIREEYTITIYNKLVMVTNFSIHPKLGFKSTFINHFISEARETNV